MSRCTECNEYDKAKHYCPKWCDVIKGTLDDVRAEEKAKTIDECKSEFLQAIQDCIDEHGERFFMSNIKESFADIAEQMKGVRNDD